MRGSYLYIQCKPMIFHISLIASIHAPRAHGACSIGIKFLHVLANPSRNAATNEEILEDIALCVVLLVELLLGCQRNYDPQKISRQSTNLHQKHKTKSNHTIFIYHPRQRKKSHLKTGGIFAICSEAVIVRSPARTNQTVLGPNRSQNMSECVPAALHPVHSHSN